MLDEFYKIGQVIEVRGQKIRIRIFENKNSNILIYQGHIIKNVSVGSFVKIPKGFNSIIGKIEGEYIQETDLLTNTRFSKESETIDRVIDVSIMGTLNNERFRRGLIDIPLIFSDVYLLADNEVQKIFEFSPCQDTVICIGSLNDYAEEKLYVDVKSLFASHIGIFGNTGSGIEPANKILDSIYPRNQGSKIILCRNTDTGTTYPDTKEEYNKAIIDPVFNALEENFASIDEYDLFNFSIKYKFIEELGSQRINEEHISPLIARFENRSKKVRQLFKISNDINEAWLSIYSLMDVNVEFKKIVPLIICKYFYDKHKQIQQEKSLHIIIDEAHNILSTSSERESQTWKDYRLETFEEIIKEGRKFGVFLTISSQRPSDISETIISQLHNYFIHRLVNNEDIRAIGKAVAFIDNNSYEMISVLPQGSCIFTGVASNFPVLVQVDQLPEDRQPKSSTIDLIKLWNNK